MFYFQDAKDRWLDYFLPLNCIFILFCKLQRLQQGKSFCSLRLGPLTIKRGLKRKCLFSIFENTKKAIRNFTKFTVWNIFTKVGFFKHNYKICFSESIICGEITIFIFSNFQKMFAFFVNARKFLFPNCVLFYPN
jgi:hypothetical protein